MSDLNLIAELDWCPACHGADWEPGDVDLCERHSAIEEDDMSDSLYTDADVETVARAVHDHACPTDPDAGCCWFDDGPACDPSADMNGFARAVLDALTAAGWTPAQQPAAPAESHVDGSHGPGWDRDTISAIAAWLDGEDEPAPECTGDQLRALLADRDGMRRALGYCRMRVDLARGELNAARRELASARRDAAADAIDRAAAKLQAYSDVHSSTVAMLRRWAAEVRVGTRTIPPADRSSDE